jgi:hypothetical protein
MNILKICDLLLNISKTPNVKSVSESYFFRPNPGNTGKGIQINIIKQQILYF